MQMVGIPVMGGGSGLTVWVSSDLHPVGSVYVIMVVPVILPETMPEEKPMPAMAGFPLFHVPPATATESVLVRPIQATGSPMIGPGSGWTVNGVVTGHPLTT